MIHGTRNEVTVFSAGRVFNCGVTLLTEKRCCGRWWLVCENGRCTVCKGENYSLYLTDDRSCQDDKKWRSSVAGNKCFEVLTRIQRHSCTGDLCILWPGLAHVSPWTLRLESLRRSITSIEMVSLPEFYALKRSEIHFSFRWSRLFETGTDSSLK